MNIHTISYYCYSQAVDLKEHNFFPQTNFPRKISLKENSQFSFLRFNNIKTRKTHGQQSGNSKFGQFLLIMKIYRREQDQ